MLNLSLQDATRIVQFMTQEIDNLSFEIRQHYEHKLLDDYHRAVSLVQDQDNKFESQESAARLVAAIEAFRDLANQAENFVRYKVLVGYDSVYPQHWKDERFEFEGVEAYRSQQVDKFIAEITPENESEWFAFIERCAATKSQDLATFPVFGQFLVDLSKRKPEIADRLFNSGDKILLGFLPAFLNGLFQSSACGIYTKNIEEQLTLGTHLSSLARHLRSDCANHTLVGRLVAKAIEAEDDIAVMESLALMMERFGSGAIDNEEELFRSLVEYLNLKRDARWVRGVWFQPKTGKFFSTLSEETARLLLINLVFFPNFDYQLERIIQQIAASYPALVWDFLGERLIHEKDKGEGERYKAVPFAFHGLGNELGQNPTLAIAAGRLWFSRDSSLFRFKGGRLISRVFPTCPRAFGEGLADLVTNGSESDVEFVMGIVQNYQGEETIHEVLKRIITRFPDDKLKLSAMKISFDNTGVVSGEFGMVEALCAKRAMLEPWRSDERPEVKNFAAIHIHELEQRIAAEQRIAEHDREMRRLNYS